MDTDLKAALVAVQDAAIKRDATIAAAAAAQADYDAAVTTAQTAHARLTELVASIIPGAGQARRVL